MLLNITNFIQYFLSANKTKKQKNQVSILLILDGVVQLKLTCFSKHGSDTDCYSKVLLSLLFLPCA